MDIKTLESLVKDQRELMQNDIQCVLDGLDDEIVDKVCQVIVDRCAIILGALPAS